MTVKKIDCEAIVLKSTPYKEKQLLSILFTKERGLLTVFSKRDSALSPLNHIECLLVPSGSCYKGSEFSIVNAFEGLRESYALLSSGAAMARELLLTQLPEKAASPLFDLLRLYLEKLPTFKDPGVLEWSFRLKRQRFDGELHVTAQCQRCEINRSELIHEGESICRLCAPRGSVALDEKGWETLKTLLYATSFEVLQGVERRREVEELCNAKGGTRTPTGSGYPSTTSR